LKSVKEKTNESTIDIMSEEIDSLKLLPYCIKVYICGGQSSRIIAISQFLYLSIVPFLKI